ncbi:MAG: hypothetical protein WBC78_06325 [Candidatus Sulfotelmatobacter sp.]
MPRRLPLFLFLCLFAVNLRAQDLAGIEIHGFVTQGVLFSSNNNYLTMKSSSGSLQWTDGAVSVSDSVTDSLRVGIQVHMYQLGQLGGPNIQVDWASGDYRVDDHFGFRAGKVKTVMGLFNDSQDIDAVFLWILLPQSVYPIDNKSFLLAHLGGDVYGVLPLGRRAGKLRYVGFAGQTTVDLNGGYVKQAADGGLVFTSAPAGKIYGGDLRWQAPWRGLTLGSSANVQSLDGSAPAGSVHVPPAFMTTDYVQFQKGKVDLGGEYMRFPLATVVTIGPVVIPVPLDQRCWHAMGSYRLLKRLHVGTYYSHYVNKAMDTTLPQNYSKDWVVSGRYDFNSYFYGKIEGHFLHGTALGYYESTNPNGLKPTSNMLAAKIGFSF